MALHSAPSVAYPLGRSRFLGALLLLAWALAALLTGVWWLNAAAQDQRPWLGLIALLLAGIIMLRGWWRSPVGQLSWSGEYWSWESSVYQGGSIVGTPQVVLDFQGAVLVQLKNRARLSWCLWAERAAAPSRWLDLRRALYARPAAVDAVATPGAAPPSVDG